MDKLSGIHKEKEWLLAVGPEGGWSVSELELFTVHGFQVWVWKSNLA